MSDAQLIIDAIRELAEEPLPARRVEILQGLVDAGLERRLTRDLRRDIAVLMIAKLIEPRRTPVRNPSHTTNKNYRPPRMAKPDIPPAPMGHPYTRGPNNQ